MRSGHSRVHGVSRRTRVLNALPTLLANPLRENFSRNPLDRLLTGRVNVEHEQRISIAEGGREVVHQVARTRIAMRLEDDMDLAKPALSRRRQCSLDLGR